jgi:hypothetical protein
VRQRPGVGDIVHGDDLYARAAPRYAEETLSDASEPVNAYPYSHYVFPPGWKMCL